MLRYFIRCLFFSGCFLGLAQNKPIDTKPKDTVVYKQLYGLRVGIDLSRPIRSFAYDTYQGLEFVGDYRLTNKLFLAGELGNEKKTRQEDLFNYTTSGSYLKLGVDYNTYSNWYGEQNSIYIGGRYAFSTFSQTLNDSQIYTSNRYWNPADFAPGTTVPIDYSNLTASWLEMLFGAKVELFAHIYLGASVRLGFLVSNKQPENFANLYIPGFNKTTEGSRFGVGYNYSLTYFIPLYKKDKKIKQPEKQGEQE